MALSDKQISQMWSEAHDDTSDRMAHQVLAIAIEAEVRKQDTELIQQLVEALENSHANLWEEEDDPERPAHAAIAAGRARLESKP